MLRSPFHLTISIGMIALSSLALISRRAVAQDCDLTQSVFQDRPGQGFELEFYPGSSDTLPSSAMVILSHPSRGVIFTFDLVESQGYPLANLVDRDRPDVAQVITFFDSDLIQSSPPGFYAFVEGLGYTDWSLNQETGGRVTVLGDVIWEFDRCKE